MMRCSSILGRGRANKILGKGGDDMGISEEPRETLHDFSIDYVKVLAEVFGWRVIPHHGREPGPDLIIEHAMTYYDEHVEKKVVERVDAVMFVESEVGHDQGGAEEYFEGVCKRIRSYVDDYRSKGVDLFSLVIITNAPRRLTSYIRKYVKERGAELREKIGFNVIEGLTIFIVPVLMVRDVMPAIFVRAMGAPARLI
jgi:GNAT superfamily N-acetyltransferase